jgi:hypothetical protein
MRITNSLIRVYRDLANDELIYANQYLDISRKLDGSIEINIYNLENDKKIETLRVVSTKKEAFNILFSIMRILFLARIYKTKTKEEVLCKASR